MEFITVKELGRSPSKYLKQANEGVDIIITRNGQPYALLSRMVAEDIEDFILAKHFDFEGQFGRAKDELRTGKTVNIRDLPERTHAETTDEVQG